MKKSLRDFRIGEKGYVKSVNAEGKIKRRLYDMGVTPGANILLCKVAPLGDPIEVTIRGYQLSLRKNEAEKILMEIADEVRTNG